MTSAEQLKFDAISHIVHDWAMLVDIFTSTHPKPYPLNHATERAFLVECRKFANFFKNNRGPLNEDAISKDFVSKRFKARLPEWKIWHDHLNRQLLHLSYARVENTTSWTGSANAPLYAEFSSTWAAFLPCIDPLYSAEFANQLRSRGL
jgi:hypothetical protein